MWLGDLDGESTNRFPLLQLRDVFLEYEPPFRLDLGLVSDSMLGKELTGSGERRVTVNVGIFLSEPQKEDQSLVSLSPCLSPQVVGIPYRTIPASKSAPNARNA